MQWCVEGSSGNGGGGDGAGGGGGGEGGGVVGTMCSVFKGCGGCHGPAVTTCMYLVLTFGLNDLAHVTKKVMLDSQETYGTSNVINI